MLEPKNIDSHKSMPRDKNEEKHYQTVSFT